MHEVLGSIPALKKKERKKETGKEVETVKALCSEWRHHKVERHRDVESSEGRGDVGFGYFVEVFLRNA
jgi:hypothetical protein